ncbi:hypothetical protein AVL48_34035 [Amycolatopsis regifaucium]|uniref:Uncharacterized protein n=2 Tax=Amycolatopsis regifaucium TaxID=546365 RepID=A0A154MJ15_9PSEU|nr:hypothetical protein AVL48_34035 [Amycolatopsis regifaucium]OKA08570.1 hypothetical protein ATP06_0211125 [Amycolatopsis regifaucium]SFJ55910.1 hypothetical protein SAMN04489731_12458 [Amycolatopsis regifaucium]
MRRRVMITLLAVVAAGVVAAVVVTSREKPLPEAAPSPPPPATTTAAPPVAFCPETAESDRVRSPSGLDGKTGPRTPSGPHRLAYFVIDDKGMHDFTGTAAQHLPMGTSQEGWVQVVVCEYPKPTDKPIGTCDGYERQGRPPLSVAVTGVQYTYKAYDAESKRLLDTFVLPGVRVCPDSVTTFDDVPRAIEARSDYTAVMGRLLPHLRV